MQEFLNNIWVWISANFIYDILKVIWLMLFWYIWFKSINKSKIKWNSNEVIQKEWRNISKIDWDKNKVEQW